MSRRCCPFSFIDVDAEPSTPKPKKKRGAKEAFSGAKLQMLQIALPMFILVRKKKASDEDSQAVVEFNKGFMLDWIDAFGVQENVHTTSADVFDEQAVAEVEEVDNDGEPVTKKTRATVIESMRGVSPDSYLRFIILTFSWSGIWELV
jgi:hypothetical protein